MQEVVPDYRDEDRSDLKAPLLRFLGLKDNMSTGRALNIGRGKFRIKKVSKFYHYSTQEQDFAGDLGPE